MQSLHDWLEKEGLQDLVEWAQTECLETVDDLAYFFTDAAPPDSHLLAHAWRLAKIGRSSGYMEARELQCKCATKSSGKRRSCSLSLRVHQQLRARRSKPLTAKTDLLTRQKAAQAAIKVALSWGSAFGIHAGVPDAAIFQRRVSAWTTRLLRFEARTVKDALAEWAKLWSHVQKVEPASSVGSGPAVAMSAVLVEDYITVASEGKGPSVAKTIYNRLLWLSRHLKAPIEMELVPVPQVLKNSTLEQGDADGNNQAVPLEPFMVRHLCQECERALRETRSSACVLSVMVMLAFIPLRYQHSRRMVPLCRTKKWVCFWVSRGKAKVQGVRAGFRWFVPRVSILAQCVDCVWDEWHKLQTQRCYADMPPTFICQQDGASMSLQQFNDAAQRELHGLLEVDAPPVTSYSFRRCAPTALDCRGADWLERLQIGGWQMDAATSAEYRCRRNTMPIRYSGQREEAEVQSKALHTIILCAALNDGVSTWEDFRTWWLGRDEDQIRAWRQESSSFPGRAGLEIAKRAPSTVLGQVKNRFIPREPKAVRAPSVPKTNMDPQRWICAKRSRALLHLRRSDAVGPVCSWRQRLKAGIFKGKVNCFESFHEAQAAGRPFCSACKCMLPAEFQAQLSL